MAFATAQLADLSGVSGRILLAKGERKFWRHTFTCSVSSSTGWSIARSFIQAGPVENVFMEPFLGNILRHDECIGLCADLPGLERALVRRATLGKNWRSERFLQKSSNVGPTSCCTDAACFVDVRHRWCAHRNLQCAGRRCSAINPARITNVKQYITGQSGPMVLSKKPKNGHHL